MKLGKTRYLRITMTKDEAEWIGADRVNFELFPNDKGNWLKIMASENGQYQLTLGAPDAAEPWRCQFSHPHFKQMHDFKAESVQVAKGPRGTLWTAKPNGDRPPKGSNKSPNHVPAAIIQTNDGFNDLRAAVAALNDLRHKYGSQLEFTVNQSGFIEVRMTLEIK
jgi:hypothetical protein